MKWTNYERPVSEAAIQPAYPTIDPSKNLVRFARITEVVLDSLGEQLLHLLHTGKHTLWGVLAGYLSPLSRSGFSTAN